MGYRTTNGLSDYNLYKLKEEAVNNGKAIWRSTITVDGTVKTLATDLAAIAAAGLKTNFQELAKLGWQPVLMLVVETLFIAIFGLVFILYAS